MQTTVLIRAKHTDYYGLKLLGSLIALTLLLAYTSFYLIQNYYSKSFLEFGLSGGKIYFLQSNTVKKMYEKNQMDYEAYEERIKLFKKLCSKNGYESVDTYSNELSTLPKDSKLLALDMMALSTTEINNIDSFVINGGRIIFNYTSGFLDDSLRYKTDNLVKRVTGLEIDEHINTIKVDVNASRYMSTKLISPLMKYLPTGVLFYLDIYDPLPIFKKVNNLVADGYMTTWPQTNYLNIAENKELTKEQSGLIWHGYKKAGKWIYFSFPSYAIFGNDTKDYSLLFKGMLEYMANDFIPIPYPYIDAKNVVFISEDTEYKYENLEQFHDVSLKHKFPVTAFCVAELAQKNEGLMKKVSKSQYMEIGSHSYTHKQIVGESDEVYEKETIGSKIVLDEMTKQNIIGFRPPREEIDKKVIKELQKGAYKYVLGPVEEQTYPYFKESIMIIPRRGTDDYTYLINLDWDSEKILEEMKRQVNIVTDLDGIYSMSTHTHIMNYSTNIKIIDNFFKYVNSQKQMTPMNGSMIYDRVSKKLNIGLTTKRTSKKFVMTISNNNSLEVKNIHYELYVDSNVVLKNIESEVIGVKTKLIKVNETTYTLIIRSMKPKSKIVLFLNYDKNI